MYVHLPVHLCGLGHSWHLLILYQKLLLLHYPSILLGFQLRLIRDTRSFDALNLHINFRPFRTTISF